MSRDELREFFLQLLTRVKAADIARKTGYSDAAISNLKHDKYNPEGDDFIILNEIYLAFGRWDCPARDNDEINADQCRTEQKRPYSAGRVQIWALCQKCTRRKS
jgi:hypothetical protein